MIESQVLADQIAYYRARAGEYDEWWFRAGRYDRGADFNAQWHAETAAVEAALASWLAARRPGDRRTFSSWPAAPACSPG